MTEPDNTAIANSIIDANRYLTLGTSDRDGTPWLTPLYYTPDNYTASTGSPRPTRRTLATSACGPR